METTIPLDMYHSAVWPRQLDAQGHARAVTQATACTTQLAATPTPSSRSPAKMLAIFSCPTSPSSSVRRASGETRSMRLTDRDREIIGGKQRDRDV